MGEWLPRPDSDFILTFVFYPLPLQDSNELKTQTRIYKTIEELTEGRNVLIAILQH